ncbi:MAG TPA: peptidylprolyl isomerase [Polyangiaceae bacterium]|nr:peptidylprolyl isomerase [Polyangiaceae bacterium]
MIASSMIERVGVGVVLASALAGSACVVTTFESPGEAPRIAPPPSPIASADPKRAASSAAPLPSVDVSSQPAEISARHLLVSYKGALRASPGIGRSKAEARTRAEEAQKRAAAGEDFVELVKQYSDEPGAGERGGDLGKFDRQSMVPAFANAAFALKVGEISTVVETQFGFHVIKRTE